MAPPLVERGSPRDVRLASYYRAGHHPAEVLFRAAAAHQRLGDTLATLRTSGAMAGPRIFPHAHDVGPLLMLLVREVGTERFARCRSMDDDLLVASFALHGVLAIHPFRDGNGRTAVDFACFLLMRRWGVPLCPLALPDDAHHAFAGALRELDGPLDEPTLDGHVATSTRLYEHIAAGAAPERLRRLSPLVDLASTLRRCVRPRLFSLTELPAEISQ